MYDIEIKRDGSFNLDTGDLKEITFKKYLGQVIYRAMMNLPLDEITSRSTRDIDIIREIVEVRLHSYLSSYSFISTDNIQVDIESLEGGNARLRIQYSDISPDGTPLKYESDFGYALDTGVLTSVEYDPSWLETAPFSKVIDVKYYVTIEEHTDEIQIPVMPYILTMQGTGVGYSDEDRNMYPYMVYLCDSEQETSVSFQDVPVSFAVRQAKMVYPLSRMCDTSVVAVRFEFTNSSLEDQYLVDYVDGELSVINTNGREETVDGTIVTADVLAKASEIELTNREVNSPPYLMKPTRGHYTARFSKTVSPGVYMIQYKGLREV